MTAVGGDLFAGAYPDPEPEPSEQPTAEVRLARRQHADVSRGIHPLTHGALGLGDHTCAGCLHRVQMEWRGTNHPKCDLGPTNHGTATDIRPWWPACLRWEKK